MPLIADILFPLAVDTSYSYAVPPALSLSEGDIVLAPLGKREAVGVVWGVREGASDNLKSVISVVDAPRLTPALKRLVDWIAWYTLCPLGSALALTLRLPDPDVQEVARVGVRHTGGLPGRMTPARARVLEAAQGGLVHAKSALAQAAGVSQAVINGLIDEGVLEPIPLLAPPAAPALDPDHALFALSEGQATAAENLSEMVKAGGFHVTLLEGVTGSGKTEVYFEAVAQALRQDKQTLILMPEIALTAQFVERFTARFGNPPGLWHSGVSGRKRERLYRSVASGEAKVVAGARSALFLPFTRLGLMIVDEEHESAYKQEDGVCYHARDIAVVRGRLDTCPVVLASATPSLESRVNARDGRYTHVRLPERYGGRMLPQIAAIDLRREGLDKARWISPRLAEAVHATVNAGEQALLFLNRRGYAPLTVCRSCGHRFECSQCSAWLVEHRFRRALVCHHCGHTESRPETCPACGAVEALTACGPGVERIAEEAATLFPDKRLIVLSSDFPGGTERLRRELAAIAAGEFDIVIGTQLVAKGHNFPLMTLVGVLDADIGLSSADPRAAERTFQLLQQVTGRAGRGDKPGRALIQTYQPDHPVMRAILSGDTERFYAEETAMRERAKLPPFGRLAALIVSGTDKFEAESYARALALCADAPEGLHVLGPAEAPIALIRGRYRFRLLVRGTREVSMQGYLRDWMARAPKAKGSVRVRIDVEPYSFL